MLENYTRRKKSCFMRLEAAARIDAASNLFTLESASMRNDQPENQEKSSNKQAEVGITTTDACTQTEMTQLNQGFGGSSGKNGEGKGRIGGVR